MELLLMMIYAAVVYSDLEVDNRRGAYLTAQAAVGMGSWMNFVFLEH